MGSVSWDTFSNTFHGNRVLIGRYMPTAGNHSLQRKSHLLSLVLTVRNRNHWEQSNRPKHGSLFAAFSVPRAQLWLWRQMDQESHTKSSIELSGWPFPRLQPLFEAVHPQTRRSWRGRLACMERARIDQTPVLRGDATNLQACEERRFTWTIL